MGVGGTEAATGLWRGDWVGVSQSRLGSEGSREPWEELEQGQMQVSEAAARTEWTRGKRLRRRKPELRPKPSEVGLCKVTSPSSKKSSWLPPPQVCYHHVSSGAPFSPSSPCVWGVQESDGAS